MLERRSEKWIIVLTMILIMGNEFCSQYFLGKSGDQITNALVLLGGGGYLGARTFKKMKETEDSPPQDFP